MSPTDQTPRLWTREAVLDHALEVAGVEPPAGRNARDRLRQFDALTHFLDRSEPHEGAPPTPGVPSRSERIPILTEGRAHLVRLADREARQERRRRERITPITPEGPMSDPHYGRVIIEDPKETVRREQADAARRAAEDGRAIPEVVRLFVTAFDNAWRTAQPEPVREHRARELAKAVLDAPERDRGPLIAWLLHRLAARRALR